MHLIKVTSSDIRLFKRSEESRAKRRSRIFILEKKRKGIKEKEPALSSFNRKSVDYERFKLYLIDKNKLNRETSVFYRRILAVLSRFDMDIGVQVR